MTPLIDLWSRYREHLREWSASLVLLPVCLYFLCTWGTYTVLDHADLIIHEAGHFVFRWLEYDTAISYGFFACAIVCFAVLLLLPLRMMGE